MLPWASTMLAYNARPPDPQFVGEGWRAAWLDRLERTPPFIEAWLRHQRRDEFWRHGSVCESPDAIQCPVYMVGGWADPYRGAVLRMLAAAPDRVHGLIGPWAHVYPHQGAPGPAIGFLELCRRLFDRHLRDEGPGLDDEPALRAWLQEAVPPRAGYDERPGRWVAETGWPPAGREPLRLFLDGDGLAPEPGPVLELEHHGLLAHGADGPTWLPWGAPADFASDQRAEDGRALAFDSAPLGARVEILGEPSVELEVVPESAIGQLAARLCDVAPDGASTLVTFGVLNLCHLGGHAEPRPLAPGEPVRVRLGLTATSYAFPAGHRVRLALSSCYWPWAWPAPDGLRLRIRIGGDAALELPARAPQPGDDSLPELPPVGEIAPPEHVQLAPVETQRRRSVDTASGRLESESDLSYFGTFELPDGLVYGESGRDAFSAVEGDPLSAEARSSWEVRIGRGDWQTRVVVSSTMCADENAFQLEDELEAFAGDELVASKRWTATIPRDLA